MSDLAHVREARHIAFCNILALKNKLLEDLPWRILFCHENNQF